MKLKTLYKRIFPLALRNRIAGCAVVESWRNRALLAEGQRLAAAAKATRTPDGKIRVTFIVQRPALWGNHASIYEAMKANPVFEVAVIAIPKRPPAAAEADLAEYRRLMAFLDEKGVAFHAGFDLNAGVWVNPLRFGLPDVVFLPQPYAFTQSYLYHALYLRNFCRLAMLNYSLTIANMPAMQYESPCFADCRYLFVDSEAHRALFIEHAPKLADRLVVTGHPKLDAYRKPFPTEMRLWKCPNAKHRLIWAPHFTVTDDRTPHHFSNFFKYYEFFLRLAQEHPELEIVMRPHPELFEHMVATGMKTRAESDAYRARFQALPNTQVYEGGDYFELFRQSDAMILDSLGFLAEYAPTGKPICFLDSMRRERLNPIGERLLHSYEAAWDEAEIRDFVERVVLGGNDARKAERLAVIQRNFYIPETSAGQNIADAIQRGEDAEKRKAR